MALIPKNDVNQIFGSQAPDQDKPAQFNNYTGGWDASRINNGKPTIKQFNYLQQRTDQNILYIHQNGGALPYDSTIEYAENATVLIDGELKQKKGDQWVLAGAKSDGDITTWSGRTQEKENKDFVTSVNDYAELSVLKAEDGRVAKVKNFGISGDFIFKVGSTLSPDGFNIVEGIGGKWLRLDARVINIGNQLLNLPESFAQNSTSKSLIAIGVDNFYATQQAIQAIAIGNGNFKDTQIVPHNNIAIGSDCMWALVNSTPYYNQSDYRGTRNIAIGGNVMSFLTTGHGNVAIGRGAGQPMTTGSENTIIGHGANGGRTPIGLSGKIENGSPNPANRNTFVGSFTGHKYIGGGSNTLVGAYAGNNLKLATTSVAIGNSCMEHYESNIDPIGYDLLWSGSEECTYTQINNTLTLNVSENHGAQVGALITFRLLDGDAKTFLNDPALGTVTAVTASSIKITSPKSYNTSGNALLLSVASLTKSVTNGSEFVAIGGSVGGTTIENARRSVMIGHTVAFQAKNTKNSVLIGENAARYGADFTSTVAIGSNSLNSTSSDSANSVATRCTAIGVSAMDVLVDGSRSYNIDVSSAFGAFARVSGSNQVQIGGPTTTTYVYGTVQNRSDLRDKADIRDTALGLDFICSLRPVDYKWDMREDYIETLEDGTVIKHEKDGSKKRSRFHHGFIAQEVPEGFGGYQDHKVNGGADVLSLGYDEFIAPLVKAVQELSKELEDLKKQLASK